VHETQERTRHAKGHQSKPIRLLAFLYGVNAIDGGLADTMAEVTHFAVVSRSGVIVIAALSFNDID